MIHVECRKLETWPSAITERRTKAPFGGNWNLTLRKLETEVSKLGADRVIIEISGNVRIRQDGWPYASESPEPPVAVSFNSDHGWLRYLTDRYDHWHGNVHAIALTLDRLRAVDRYGTTRRAEQYTGFAALSAGTGTGVPDPIKVVAELVGVNVVDLEASPAHHLKTARRLTHPDNGGSHDKFLIVQQAAQLLKEASQ